MSDRPGYPVAVAVALPVLIWLRCPSVMTRAQFWAEDGWRWYPDAYDLGWRSIFDAHAGYLQTISRLTALASLPAPISWAPALFALVALSIQAGMCVFLLSPRMEAAISSLRIRIFLALIAAALPGTRETFVNLTNAQWYLAVLAFLVLSAAPPATRRQRAFDVSVLALSGLSGPFALFLVPPALVWWRVRRDNCQLSRLAIVGAAGAVQLFYIIALSGERDAGQLDASLHGLVSIIVVQVLAPALLGLRVVLLAEKFGLSGDPAAGSLIPAALIVAMAAVLTVIAAVRGSWILRCFLLFTGLEFAASLLDGIVPAWWHVMQISAGGRYFLHPVMAWICVMISLSLDQCKPLRIAGIFGVAMSLLVAVPNDYALAKLPPTAFYREAAAFDRSAPGSVTKFEIRPYGAIYLVRR
jgi:hypothetical protein